MIIIIMNIIIIIIVIIINTENKLIYPYLQFDQSST